MLLDGQPEPARVRFSYLADDVIRDLAATFPAPPETQPEPVVQPAAPKTRASKGQHVYRPTTAPKQGAPLLPPSLLNALDLNSTNGSDPR